MKRTVELILVIAVLIGMLGLIAGLVGNVVKLPESEDPDGNSNDSASGYTLSGDWIVDVSATFTDDFSGPLYERVYYDYKGVSFSDMRLAVGSEGAHEIWGMIVGDSTGDAWYRFYTSDTSPSDTTSWSGDENLRRVSFGSKPQTVSPEFYKQFTSIAKKAKTQSYIEPDRTFHKISGVWVLNSENLLFPDFGLVTERVNLTAGGKTWTSVDLSSLDWKIMLNGENFALASVYDRGEWVMEGYDVWNFGETEIIVNNAFYRFLIANAQKQ